MTRTDCAMILVLVILFSGCRSSFLPEEEMMHNVDSLIKSWVPDSRENLLSVKVKKLRGIEFLISGETNLPTARDAILDYMKNSGVKFIDSLKVLPDTTLILKRWGLVTVSVCNMKKEPSYASELVSQAIMGTPVKILNKNGGWFLVQTPDHYLGWINDSSIEELNDTEIESWKNSKRLIFTNRFGDIFSNDEKGGLVSDIVAGAILVDCGDRSGISYVSLPDGRKGKIPRESAVDFGTWCSTVKPEPEKLIRFAKMFTGHPYLWGGTSTYAVDCSGFVKTVYFTGGVILARDASQQFIHGIKVDISSTIDSLKPADLVFFGYVNKAGEKRIIHVGIYIGDTEVIHSSGMVRINSLDSTRSNYSKYLGKGIMGARRVIGAGSASGTESVALNYWYTNQK